MRLQVAPCGFFAIDDDRRIVAVNDKAQSLLGYGLDELVGKNVSMVLPPAVRILFQTAVYPVVAEGRPVEELYTLLRSRSGEDVPVLMSAARRREGEEHQTQFVFLAVKRRSLFERHLEHLEALRREVQTPPEGRSASPSTDGEIAERMWTLGLLLAGIMHEVRNPLTYVQGNLQLLSADLESPDPATFDWESARESVREASEGADRILELVRAVGTVSHVEPSRPLPVDVARVVETAARLVRYRLSRVAKLEVDGPKPGEVVLADEPRLVQVLMNLLVNAGQALEASRPAEPLIVVRHRTEGDLALIDVSDNGPGISETLRERVFQPFYTTKPLGEGTGLGLALSRQIIASFNGSLELAPSKGSGATFRICLPLAAP